MVKLVGYKHLEGNSKKTGKPYNGYALHFTIDDPASGFDGLQTGNQFVSLDRLIGTPYLGGEVIFNYDYRGFLTSVTVQ